MSKTRFSSYIRTSMRIAFTLLLLSLPSIHMHAASGAVQRSIMLRTYSPTDPADRLQALRDEIKYYRGMKTTGAGITGMGVAFFAAGQGMLWSSVALNQSGKRSYSPTARDPLWLAGLGGTVLSAVPFAFGIPLLRYGTKKVKELKKQIPKPHPLQ